jgi:chromate transporter
MVILLAALYVRFDGLEWMRGAFYAIGASVIAVIARSAAKLVRVTPGKDRLLQVLCALNAVVTVLTESELVSAFLLSGIAVLIVKAPPRVGWRVLVLLPGAPPLLATGLGPAASEKGALWDLGVFFAQAGSVVFGSGLAIVPYLYGGVVEHHHWLTDRQFLDAVAVAMITPGPVVITVSFIGYLVGGLPGALVAAFGVFLPCYLLVILPAPYFRYVSENCHVRAFVDGVTAAATGAIVGAAVVLGRRAIIDTPTALFAGLTLALLVQKRRPPEPLVILAAGLIGAVAFGRA